ncbi:hypothetical protein, partial [Chryseobacterium sp.]|uniref:hypothetical protein n=1 Tax=Chryseobacterium sp. TaxID=1871047 RepID=UPI00284CD48E
KKLKHYPASLLPLRAPLKKFGFLRNDTMGITVYLHTGLYGNNRIKNFNLITEIQQPEIRNFTTLNPSFIIYNL